MDEAASTPAPGFQPGMIVGRKFALIRWIATGGVGSIYEAQDLLVRRRVALKLLNPEYAHIPELRRRFMREAQATAAVGHPNVVTVLEMGRFQNGSYYIAQELLRGPCLRDHLAACGRFDVGDALDIMLPIMDALSAAHRRGVVHRDVKPENILLSTGPSGEMVPKLVDFGAAKVSQRRRERPTHAGVLLGTPSYMAPEQVEGARDLDSRVDVWAVGVVLAELISGRLLFPGGETGSPGVTYAQILHEAELRIADVLREIPSGLRQVLAGALRPNPDERYPTMSAFRRELWAIHGSSMIERHETPLPPRVSATGMSWVEPEAIDHDWEESEEPEQRFPRMAADSIPEGSELALGDPRHDRAPALTEKARAAEDALGRNALEQAIATAEEVLASADDELRPRMWLLFAIAQLWRGNYSECARGGREAMASFEPRSTGWYVALGHLATASGSLGDSEALSQLAALIADQPDEPTPARDVAACRLAVVLLRAGERPKADALVQLVNGSPEAEEHSLVCAWREVLFAELASQAGDVSRYLGHTEAATEHFTFAGDVRNACLQRHNVGNALMLLGAYQRAEIVFREVLDLAEPMKLNLVPGALANLGFTLSRIGALDTAWEIESRALALCAEQGHRRFEAVASLYLALILAMQRDVDAAVQLARSGVTLAAASPPTLAQAHAVLAAGLLLRDESAEALVEARAAMDLLERLGGVEEGEALIRLVYMSSLAREGDAGAARAAAREARERLQERAERIANPSWRRSFLNDVPEHAHTLLLASQWLDDEQTDAAPVQNTLMGLAGLESAKRPAAAASGAHQTQPGLGKGEPDDS